MRIAPNSTLTLEKLLVACDSAAEVVTVTLNQPKLRNPLSLALLRDLGEVLDALEASSAVRAVVLRGAGGTFCAGGNIRDFDDSLRSQPGAGEVDPIARINRGAGALLLRIRRLPATVIAAIEGAAIGGGFGLACVSDIAIATLDAKFAMTETTLGVTPAQISPFVATRIGVSQALRLALSGERIDGLEAQRIGLVHHVCEDARALDRAIGETISRVLDCAPHANRVTKELFLATAELGLTEHLDYSAGRFARCLRGEEGREGVRAFLAKRPPAWARGGAKAR